MVQITSSSENQRLVVASDRMRRQVRSWRVQGGLLPREIVGAQARAWLSGRGDREALATPSRLQPGHFEGNAPRASRGQHSVLATYDEEEPLAAPQSGPTDLLAKPSDG
jgi:hypothetical protein